MSGDQQVAEQFIVDLLHFLKSTKLYTDLFNAAQVNLIFISLCHFLVSFIINIDQKEHFNKDIIAESARGIQTDMFRRPPYPTPFYATLHPFS